MRNITEKIKKTPKIFPFSSTSRLPNLIPNNKPIWHFIDASGWRVGRLAVHVSNIIQGKHKPTYDPAANCGDNVVIVNAEKVEFTGNKDRDKLYIYHTGHHGGLKKIPVARYRKNFPERILQRAIHGMLPSNKLRGRREKKLRIYCGPNHPHEKEERNALEKVKIELAIRPHQEKPIEELKSLKDYSIMDIEVKNIDNSSRVTLYAQQAFTEFDLFEKEWNKLQNNYKSQLKLYQLGKGKKPNPIAFPHFDQFVQHRLQEELAKEKPFEEFEILDPQRYNELVKTNYEQLKPYQRQSVLQSDDYLDSIKPAFFNPPQKYLDSVQTMDLTKPDYQTPWIPGSRKFNFIPTNKDNYIPTKSEREEEQIKQEFAELPWPEDDPELKDGPTKFFFNSPKIKEEKTKSSKKKEKEDK
eukprot:TRINITY_DN17540_c0_g1_i1.p1 TRINITY_DN17540_c0_g1~~TRINITY_DN17540_c0_g1_i1.p1  ORF type:complete len:412 (+),score=139.84 TRINITY_DN17540_c0_g1_i1:33-1268(+)